VTFLPISILRAPLACGPFAFLDIGFDKCDDLLGGKAGQKESI
jgi:hypothetical protein